MLLFSTIRQSESVICIHGLPRWHNGKESACQCRRPKTLEFNPLVRKISCRRAGQPPPVFVPGESYGQMAGDSPWGCKELDMTKVIKQSTTHTHIYNIFSLFFEFPSYLGHHRALNRFPCAIQ